MNRPRAKGLALTPALTRAKRQACKKAWKAAEAEAMEVMALQHLTSSFKALMQVDADLVLKFIWWSQSIKVKMSALVEHAQRLVALCLFHQEFDHLAIKKWIKHADEWYFSYELQIS